MTTLSLIVGFFAAVGVAIGVVLRLLYRTEPVGDPEALLTELLEPTRSALENYQPMSRLFAEEDFNFLSRLQPGMANRLRRQRQRVLRLYLRELRVEFERVYAFCRALALKSPDPNFGSFITQQFVAFYGLLLVLHVRCTLGWFLHVRVDTVDLVNAFDRLRQAAQAALSPQPVMAGNAA